MPTGEATTHKRVNARVDPTNQTQQAPKDACDVNMIMKTYEKTGVLTHENAHKPVYGDFSTASDYQEAKNAVNAAEAEFAGFSAEIRRRFDNDPRQMLLFLDDPNNLEEAVSLGLVVDDKSAKSPIRRSEPEPAPKPGETPAPGNPPIPEDASPIAGGD